MRIVQVVSHLEPGGALRVARDLGEAVGDRDGDSHVVALRQHLFDRPQQHDRVLVAARHSYLVAGLLAARRLRRVLARLRPDAVLSHTPTTSALVSIVAALAAVPVRVVVHHAPSEHLTPLARRLDRVLGRLGVHTHVVFVGDAVAESFSGLGAAHRARCRVIVNGVAAAGVAEEGPPEHETDAVLRSRPARALFVGRLDVNKNVSVIVEAMAALEGTATLVVVGDGPEMADLRSRAERLGSPVTFVGFQDPAAVAELYLSSDLLLFPSLPDTEALPLVLIEALSARLPVVASSIAPAREILGAAAIFCDPVDVTQWTEAIQALADDPELRDWLGRQAAKEQPRFGRDRMAQEYWDLVAAHLGTETWGQVGA